LARNGFNLIHAEQLAKAEGVFTALEGKSPLYFQGMSAVYLNRGNIEKAEHYLWLGQQEETGSPHLDLIKAHLAFSRRQLNESETGYRKVLEVKRLEGWQQAECHYGLGRVFLARGEIPQAIDEFDKALNLDPSFIQVYTAKGLALERSGKLRDALDLYRKATEINPEDPVNAALSHKGQELLDYRESAEYQARVEQQISDLLKTDREAPLPAGERDKWTSRPLYLLFLSLEAKGRFAPREGEDAYINELISRDLGHSNRIHMVESGLLDRLIEELNLESSQLADSQTALRVANVLSAQVLITGMLLRSPGELQIILRAADTQANRVVATASGTCQCDGDPAEMLQTLVADLEEQVVAAYPVRGLVTTVESGEIILNVGSAVGVSPGMSFRLMEESEDGVELTVYEVNELTSKAISSSDEIEIQECWRVEELQL
jgi:tetratricopeptide (TPR) repeat protein